MALQTADEMAQEIAAGVIPQTMREQYRLLREDHPSAQMFERHAHRIAARLLGPSYDPSQIRFMLSADKEPNGFIMQGVEPPLICLSRGLIELAQSEDEIAAVIAHELNHKHVRDRLGLHDNSKGEEAFADLRAITMLRDAGYRQDAMRVFMERLPETAFDIFATLTDPHPNKDMRVRLCSNAEKAINLHALEGKGEQDIGFTLRPAELTHAMRSAVYPDRHIDNVLEAEGFDRANVVQQAEIMKRVIPRELALIGAPEHAIYDFRAGDLAGALRRMKPDVKSPAHQKAYEELVDVILATPEKAMQRENNTLYSHIKRLYSGAEEAWEGEQKDRLLGGTRPVGRLKATSDAITALKEAKSAADAEKAARTINATCDSYFDPAAPLRSAFVRDVAWPRFDQPWEYQVDGVSRQVNATPEHKREKLIAKIGITASWDKQARWAQETGSQEIALALTNLGVTDPRLPALQPDVASRVHPEMKPYDAREFDYSASGRVIGKKDSIFTAANQRPPTEEEKAAQKNREETTLLQGDAWKREMESDFHGFVQKYKAQLLPAVCTDFNFQPDVPEGTAFAQAFTAHLRVLLQREPAKYKPLAEEFFGAHHEATPPGLMGLINEQLAALKVEQYSLKSYRMAPDHPYVQFALENPGAVLSDNARMKVIDRCHYYVAENVFKAQMKAKYGHDSIEASYPYRKVPYDKCWRLDPQACWPMPPLKSFADLNALMQQIKDNPDLQRAYDEVDFYQDRVRYHVTQFLEQNKAPCNTDEMWTLVALKNKYYSEIPHTRLEELIEKQLERNVAHDLASNLTPEEMVKNYIFYSSGGTELFAMRPALKRSYEEKLTGVIGGVADVNERNRLTWKILEEVNRLEQPDFRHFVVNTYVGTTAQIIGKECDANRNRLGWAIDNVFKRTSGDVRYAILTRLADATETQRALTMDIQKKLDDCALEKIVKSKMEASLGEAFLAQGCRDEKFRFATLNFLTAPKNDRSIHTFKNALMEFVKKNEYAESRKTLLEFYSNNVKAIEKLRLFHENFWALPFEGRQLALDKILFPVHEKTQAEFDRNMRYALDKVFPSTLSSDDRIGRDIVHSFLQVCDEEERRLLLSAMLVANEPGTERDKGRNVGKTLNQLKALGPAGDKLLQAIHSHPATLEHIREEIGESKSNSQWVPRWKVFEWLDQFGPDTTPGNPKTVKVGKLLGVGAYGATVALEKDNGEQTACTLLKPSADSLAATMFTKFGAASEILLEKRKKLKPVREMIGQAGRMSKIETDMAMAERQAQVAAENYNGMGVSIGGQDFTFQTAKWVGNGQRYKETAIVEGKHFNELPVDTAQARQFKADAAKAQLAAELYLRLSGRAVDHDRHGAQQRINGTCIGVFDHGGQAVTPPSDEEKRLMGLVLTNTLRANYGYFGYFGKPLNEALTQEIQKAGKTAGDRDYLAAMQRDILALGDFAKSAAESQQPGQNVMKDIVGAVMRTGDVDPIILGEIKRNLGRYFDRAMQEMMESGKDIKITPAPKRAVAAEVVEEAGKAHAQAHNPSFEAEEGKTNWAQQVARPEPRHPPVRHDPHDPDKPAHFSRPKPPRDSWREETRERSHSTRQLTGAAKE